VPPHATGGMDEFDNEVRLTVYRRFVADGHPPAPAAVARELGCSPLDVEGALHRLAEARLVVLAPGTPYVWMANPLSALPTPFRVKAGDSAYWGTCIWDSLGILAMLDSDGTVDTSCPDCAEPLRVAVEAGKVSAEGPAIGHFAVPAASWWDNIGHT
jgi:hypothetical protein